MIWARVRKSLRHRPWNLDIISGLTVMAFGAFTLIDPTSMETRHSWDFLDPLNLSDVGIIQLALGFSQTLAALINVMMARWWLAFLVMWHWGGFAFGLHHYDPDAISIVLIASAAVSNMFILIRLY
jgi:hypothetical protein